MATLAWFVEKQRCVALIQNLYINLYIELQEGVWKATERSTEKLKKKKYIEKGIFQKVGKCPINIVCMLILHVQKWK